MKNCLTLLAFMAFCLTMQAQYYPDFDKETFVDGKDTLRYRILYPVGFMEEKKFPVVIFLHGIGERGTDNEKQLAHGADIFLQSQVRNHYPAIVVFPQCPPDSQWAYYNKPALEASLGDSVVFPFRERQTEPERLLKQFLDVMIADGNADPARIYIGGLSMGAVGTYDMLIRYPGFFAAAFPMCGGTNTAKFLPNGKSTPLWIFHGDNDDVMNPKYDRDLVAALKKRGANVKYTEYPAANHNCWDMAFAEPGLLPWLFAKHR